MKERNRLKEGEKKEKKIKWAGFICLRMGSRGGLLRTRQVP
jgi:hypothetical protein